MSSYALSHWILAMLAVLMWSLKDRLIHKDCDCQHCEFPRESDALYQAPSYTSSTSNHVHHGKSLQQYLEEDRIHQENIETAKHFEYQEKCKVSLAKKVYCPWQYSCEHCKQKKNKSA